MNNALLFTKRNIVETLRSPASWGFGAVMPLGILIIMQVIVKSIGRDAATNVPMFAVDAFTGGTVVFGASFISMLCVLLISRDISDSFLTRLFVSPMRSSDFIIGYALSMMPLLLLQIVLVFFTAMAFGLTLSVNILAAILLAFLSSMMFIALGILFGCLLPAKAAPPVCSVVVQMAALLSGMWIPLETIGGGLSIFCHILPFANAYDVIKYTIIGEYSKVWIPLIIVLAYTVAFGVLAVLAFKRRMRNN